MMKVLVFGLGSIGRRHLKVLRRISPVNVLALRHTQNAPSPEVADLIDDSCQTIEEALAFHPDAAIVANPTSCHREAALMLCRAGIPFLLEKPVGVNLEGMEEVEQCAKSSGLPILVGYQMRYHPGYELLKREIAVGRIGKVLHCEGYVGQYLPDWRPGVDYRKNYSALKDLGGGVLLDLSHEVDLVGSLLGAPRQVACLQGRCSELEIETEDFADLLIRYERGNAHIHLNYLERNYTWYTRVTGERGTLIWRYDRGCLDLEQGKGAETIWACPAEFDRDALFEEQMRHFLDVVNGKAMPRVSLESGIETLSVIEAAKRSSAESRFYTIEDIRRER